ncbi:MAG TPA: lysylphosphatidylglycerol synthase transmembrane domain-containing protein [Ktedonobacteraceae bacterium]|jgi:uncharacterized protein (TIRG00374 family)|nr:lysylphosphatidylglycerol synthase transmembrane domain-containing protein [Ktedonobacteraceae bacterium]
MQEENQYDPDHRIRSTAPEDVQRIPTARESDSAEKQNKGIEDFSRPAALRPGEEVQKQHAILHGSTFELNEEDYKFDDDHEQERSKQSKQDLMKLSGMVQTDEPSAEGNIEEYWPKGIKQTGAVPVVNIYGTVPFGRTNPDLPTIQPLPETPLPGNVQPVWKRLLKSTTVRVILGLLIGIGLLFLISKIVNIPATIAILRVRLTTPQGIGFALLSGIAFLAAFSIRGVRWKLFLNPIGKVSTLKAIQLFLVGIFLNFLLPIRGGEVAKSLMLKRISNIPISQSLPTVAMDKALDLMPALFIMALVPALGVSMDIKLWFVLAAVGGLLVCLIFFIVLAAWKRSSAITLLQKLTGLLPKRIGEKIEGFATGFVDSLLAGASQPRIFIPAILLTIVAVVCDGLFAMFAFDTVGVAMPFGIAIFGYTVYNMFYILPTPPGQVGSNEAIGLLIFTGLLHFSKNGVTAMFLFSHPWAALLMCVSGLMCLSALGLTVSSAMGVASNGARGEKQDEYSDVQPAVMAHVELPVRATHAPVAIDERPEA